MSAYSYRDGYTTVTLIDSDTEYRVSLSEYTALCDAWTSGAAFLTFTTVHGARVTLKGARVEAIGCYTADDLAEFRRLIAEEKNDAMLRGDD